MKLSHIGIAFSFLVLAALPLGGWVHSASAEGLTGYYYHRAKKNGPVVNGPHDFKVVDSKIDFATNTWAWQPQGWTENFSVYWTGWIYIEKAGSYIFATFSDDGSFLYIDDHKIVENNSGAQEPAWQTGTIRLAPGYHRIDIVYYNWKDSSGIGLYWDTGIGARIVPGDILYPADFTPPASER